MAQLVFALDYANKEEAFSAIEALPSDLQWVKVGMQLFYKEGPSLVMSLKDRGLKVFLDLKLHDIPHTVAAACRSLASLGVDMLNVHALGGVQMMQAARENLPATCILLAVTQLTSSSEAQLREEMQLRVGLQESVLSLAAASKKAGLQGVVCSVHESLVLKEHLGENFLTLCPGIRFADQASDDQVRIATPTQAFTQKVDYAVLGRAIAKAAHPQRAFLLAQTQLQGEKQ